MTAIISFLEGRGVDDAGRLIGDVWRFDEGDLERGHDFIQWLFPLPEPSLAVPGSPILSEAEVAAVRASPAAQEALIRSAKIMAQFYETNDHWLRPRNHNHLRITRIIKSLRLLVDDAAADQFREHILAKVTDRQAAVGSDTWRYWSKA